MRDVKVDPDSWRDLQYQINRPRESREMPGLLINRLSKWGVLQLEVTLFTDSKRVSRTELVRLEVDISSDKDSQRELSSDKAAYRLFSEFRKLGKEIASSGDIE